jgi:hypothetical protein
MPQIHTGSRRESAKPRDNNTRALGRRMTKPPGRGHRIRRLSAAVFLVACAAPAIDLGDKPRDGPHGVYRGGAALAYGWLSTFTTVERALQGQGRGAPAGDFARIVADHAWSANVFLLAGWLLFRRRPGAAAVAGLIALSIGVTYLIYPLRGRLPGVYLWVGSLVLFSIGTLAAWRGGESAAVSSPRNP